MQCLILTRRQVTVFLSSVLAVAVAVIGTVSVFAQSERKLPIYCVETEKKQIAISFDAAWGADDTDTLIEILGNYNVKATFFVVGAWVDKYPDEVKKLSEAGHRVENHSNTHPHMTNLSAADMEKEIQVCNEKIAAVTNRVPKLLRPPYGDYNNAVVEAVANAGMYPIQWSVDSLDWKENATADSIIKNITTKVKPGSIILCHNDAKYTPAALPTVLKTLIDDGYEFVLIEDLILKDNYTIDHSGMQCKNTQ